MAKRMLIDATHPEETRVVVLNGNRLEEFDFESSTKQQVKGNIYLAKVTRVEPSLQAAFVEYGGNRHGFLAFSEIHPDYFRIPVGDREAAEPGAPRPAGAESEFGGEPAEDTGVPLAAALPEPVAVSDAPTAEEPVGDEALAAEDRGIPDDVLGAEPAADEPGADEPGADTSFLAAQSTGLAGAAAENGAPPADGRNALMEEAEARASAAQAVRPWEDVAPFVPAEPEPRLARPASEEAPEQSSAQPASDQPASDQPGEPVGYAALRADDALAEAQVIAAAEWSGNAAEDELPAEASATAPQARALVESENGEAGTIETIGGDEFDDAERQRSRAPRHYKIQEVIKRRQIMLVQVTKEERGNKGAALTTYLSLAGRYCVLMPNTARGGGVSRKITSISDRRRLKDILEELDIPEGMGVIVRTAGAERSKAEIKRDYEYLLRLWNEIRELTLRSTAPASIYEEGNLIKRSIRDLYTRDIDEVLVEGEEGYRTAKAFMKMLMPSHAKRVQPYRDRQIGLLHRFQVESQIDAIHSPIVQLRSGGYIVINQTEALVAIDVNSGRSTRERNIEETALRTNLEAADEIARQLRLRDLAGLIVIDLIDMEEHRNQGAVERRLKDALKNDRARIQVGRISPFGLLEMSRQRLRPSLVEASTQPCPHCGGTGFVRSTESTALYVLRSIEEEGMRLRSAEVCVYVPTTVALYILNHKRDSLAQLEARYGVHVLVARDDALIPPAFRLGRLRAYEPGDAVPVAPAPLSQQPEIDEEGAEEEELDVTEAGAERRGQDDDEERNRARRRRRRRRRHDDERGAATSSRTAEDATEPAREPIAAAGNGHDGANGEEQSDDGRGEDDKLRRRRGRRGGRRRGRREEAAGASFDDPRPASETVEIVAISDSAESDDRVFSAVGSEPLDAAVTEWPTDPSIDERGSAGPTASTGIDAESLPALAGEPMADRSAPETDGSRTTPGIGNEEGGSVPLAAAAEPGALGAVEAGVAEFEASVAASPPAFEPSPEAAAPEPQPELVPAVQRVTEKPPSPRKGWWQRFIQS
jgi:ribonuclease E